MGTIKDSAQYIYINYIKYKDLRKTDNLLALLEEIKNNLCPFRWQNENMIFEIKQLIEEDKNE